MIAYDKAREHLRADILLASRLFADTDALVAWLFEERGAELLSEEERVSLGLIVRTMQEAREGTQKAS